ncbi:MAG: glutamate-1-semialdehyde 2,1-aminomutase [Acidimicrobiales bacterium]
MTDANAELFERALGVIPGGVNSPVRAFNSVGGTPYFVALAQGAHVTDENGKRYIDMVQSYGAIILGHAHPVVVEAITRAAQDGTSYGAPTRREVELAEQITGLIPSCDQIRLVNSGTEATMSAVRLARGATGRDKILKFAGNYHGHADGLMAAAGSAVMGLGLPGSAGVPAAAVADTLVAPYNEVPVLDDTVAAVIVEPVAANMGLVAPTQEFLDGLRAECDRAGSLLIFDEVITGFRLGLGGAQQRFGITPDLSCFGKVIGGGLPIAAFGGRAEIMEHLAPAGAVYQAGTLSGNPLATAAGLAVLGELDSDFYSMIEARVSRLVSGLSDAVAPLGATVPQMGTLYGIYFGTDQARNYEAAKLTDEKLYANFFHGMLRGGVAMAPGAYEVGFVGGSHSNEIVDEVIATAHKVAAGLS